jgi:hypothetical protein
MKKITKKITAYEVIKDSLTTGWDGTERRAVAKLKRPTTLTGQTFKVKSHHYEHAYYFTVNMKDGKPFEIFCNTANKDNQMWIKALTRAWSATMRVEGDVGFLIKDMLTSHDPKGGHFSKKMDDSGKMKQHDSIIAEIGYILNSLCFAPTLHEVREEIAELSTIGIPLGEVSERPKTLHQMAHGEVPELPTLEQFQYIDAPCVAMVDGSECGNTVWREVEGCPVCEGVDGCGYSKCG